VYIGSTFNSTRNRWQEHKSDYRKYLNGKHSCVSIYPYFEKFGIENFKIIRIKEYECYRENRSDRRHLNVYEQLWINKTRNCVNKYSPFRIEKLSKKQYSLDHKDEIRNQRKQYRLENKEELKEIKKQFYDKNRHKILEQKKQYQKENKDKISQRRKELYNKEKNSELCKIYREKNKEQISERRKQPKFCIICKKNITNNYFKQHTRTKTHIQNAKQVIYNFINSKKF
jgi:hypothetical protein